MPRPTELDLRDYARILFRRKWWMISATLASLGLAFAINALTEPVYRASLRIHVQREATRSPLTGEAIESPTSQSENLALYTAAELITNRKLLARALESLEQQGLSVGRPVSPAWRSWLRGGFDARNASASLGEPVTAEGGRPRTTTQRDIDGLMQRISVEPVRDTRLVNIHVEHSDPRTAEAIANTVADQFVQFQVDSRTAGSSQLIGYLSSQLQEVRESLQEGERAAAYNRAVEERKEAEERLARAQSGRDIDPTTSANLGALQRRLIENESELAKARQIYKDRHPRLVMLESDNQQIRASIRTETDRATSGVRSQYRAALTRALARERELESHASSRPAAALEGELANQRELYAALLTKLKEAEITSQVRQPQIEVVEPASANPSPIRPRKALNFLVCTLAGVTVGVGLSFLREYLRRTIRTPQDVDDHLQLPVLGLIPKA